MNFHPDLERTLTRRTFLARSTTGLGALALSSLLNPRLFAASDVTGAKSKGALQSLHFAPKAKRVIYLFQSGAPSHLDLFDPKPKLKEMTGEELPPSVRMGQRITGMTAGQSVLRCVGSPYEFQRYGKNGVELSSLIPHIGSIVDEIALIRSMHVEQINHDPAVTFFQTGHQQPGRPTMGAWIAYGLAVARYTDSRQTSGNPQPTRTTPRASQTAGGEWVAGLRSTHPSHHTLIQ